jgi:hypothetical protein
MAALMPLFRRDSIKTMTHFANTVATGKRFNLSRSKLKELRLGRGNRPPALSQNVHWFYIGRDVRFNVDLLHDFLLNQNNPEAHDRAIAAYLESLPSSKAAA